MYLPTFPLSSINFISTQNRWLSANRRQGLTPTNKRFENTSPTKYTAYIIGKAWDILQQRLLGCHILPRTSAAETRTCNSRWETRAGQDGQRRAAHLPLTHRLTANYSSSGGELIFAVRRGGGRALGLRHRHSSRADSEQPKRSVFTDRDLSRFRQPGRGVISNR